MQINVKVGLFAICCFWGQQNLLDHPPSRRLDTSWPVVSKGVLWKPFRVTEGRMRMCRHQLSWGWAILFQSCSKWTATQQSHCLGPGWSWEFSCGSCSSLNLAKTRVSSRLLEEFWVESTVVVDLGVYLGFGCVAFVDKILLCHINAVGVISVILLAIGRAGGV